MCQRMHLTRSLLKRHPAFPRPHAKNDCYSSSTRISGFGVKASGKSCPASDILGKRSLRLLWCFTAQRSLLHICTDSGVFIQKQPLSKAVGIVWALFAFYSSDIIHTYCCTVLKAIARTRCLQHHVQHTGICHILYFESLRTGNLRTGSGPMSV